MNKRHCHLPFLFVIFLSAFFPALYAQTAPARTAGLQPGTEPPDVSVEWKQLVGLYGDVKEPSITVLEHNQKLYWRTTDDHELEILPAQGPRNYRLDGKTGSEFTFERNETGNVLGIVTATPPRKLPRSDAGSDPSRFYHITLSKPVEEFRAVALAATPPKEAGPFRKPDLVELAPLDAGFHLDIRYAGSNNFLSTPVYTQARAFLQRPAADALLRVLHKLKPLGYGILIHDAYRPWYVTKIFWDATPPEDHIFVADPQKGSRHNRGCAVDLTLYDLASGKPIEMPGLYDEMSQRSFPTFPGGTSLQRWHRDLLRRAMESEGFTVNENEWWHFDYKDWKLYPILNVRFEDLHTTSANSGR